MTLIIKIRQSAKSLQNEFHFYNISITNKKRYYLTNFFFRKTIALLQGHRGNCLQQLKYARKARLLLHAFSTVLL